MLVKLFALPFIIFLIGATVCVFVLKPEDRRLVFMEAKIQIIIGFHRLMTIK